MTLKFSSKTVMYICNTPCTQLENCTENDFSVHDLLSLYFSLWNRNAHLPNLCFYFSMILRLRLPNLLKIWVAPQDKLTIPQNTKSVFWAPIIPPDMKWIHCMTSNKNDQFCLWETPNLTKKSRCDIIK